MTIVVPEPAARVCDVCKAPLRADNQIGVCQRTPECAREGDRRRNRQPRRIAYTAAYNAEYYRENAERAREYSRLYREAHGDQCRQVINEWRQQNPEKCREYHRNGNRRRESRLAEVSYEPIDERLLWELNDRTCYLCGKYIEFGSHHVDHIVPLLKGGATAYENLAVTHPGCNLRKSHKLVTDPLADLRPAIAELARKGKVTL